MDANKQIFGGWLAANVISFLIGFIIGAFGLVILLYLDTPRIEYLNPTIMGFILGLVIGFGQYLALKSKLPLAVPFLFMIAWAIGLSIGFLAVLYQNAYLSESMRWSQVLWTPVAGLLSGGAIGLLQWISLRQIHCQAWRWIPWNMVAGAVVFCILLLPTTLLVASFGGYEQQSTSNEAGYLGATLATILCIFSSPLAGLLTGLITWRPLKLLTHRIISTTSPINA